MSKVSSSNHVSAPAETGSVDGTHHTTFAQTQAPEIQSFVSTYPELPADWKSGLSMNDRLDDRENDFTEEERRDAWKVVDEAVKTYSDELVQRWIAEMDTLLVYAGLFSAVLTAFNVESYSLLSPTAPDPVVAALTQISAQLASFSVHDPFVNSTNPTFQPSSVSSNTTSAQAWAVWLNALWFSSLICSLSAASVAIMVKQWIHEYNSGISGTSRHTARLRQHRYNGLVQWKVAEIIAVLPILLQIALGLFLAGILVLLWNLNRTVAIVASTLVGALLAFTLVTIILPTFTSNCAYLSPLSIFLFRLCHPIHAAIRRLIYNTVWPVCSRAVPGSSLQRISLRLWYTCRDPLPPSVYAMQSEHVTTIPRELDQDVFVTAYSTTGDVSLLEQASTCFSNHSIKDLSEFLTRIHAQNREYGQPAGLHFHWTLYIPLDIASDMMLVRAWNTFGTFIPHTSNLQQTTSEYLSFSHVVVGDHRVSYVLSNMAAVLYHDDNRDPDSRVYRCLSALKNQMHCVKETNIVLKDAVRRRVIAAIHAVLCKRHASLLHMDPFRYSEYALCLHILILCNSSSISQSQSGDLAEEDTKWKPLADAIAFAQDVVTRGLQCPEHRDLDNRSRFILMNNFFADYQEIGIEQLARRVSDKMLRALAAAAQDLTFWDEARKHDQLEWLKSLEKERDKQLSTRAAHKDEGARLSSSIVEVGQGPRS